MAIRGKFYTSKELQKLLGVSKQRISNLSNEQNWESPHPGIYYAQSVESYLMGRGVDLQRLKVVEWESTNGPQPPAARPGKPGGGEGEAIRTRARSGCKIRL